LKFDVDVSLEETTYLLTFVVGLITIFG